MTIFHVGFGVGDGMIDDTIAKCAVGASKAAGPPGIAVPVPVPVPVIKETDGEGVGADIGADVELVIVEVIDGDGVGGEGVVVGNSVGE